MNQYILYSVLFSGVSIIAYRLLLKREKIFQFNRFYLIGTLVLSLFLPLIQFESEFAPATIEFNQIINENNFNTEITSKHLNGDTVQIFTSSSNIALKILIAFYLLVAILLIIRYVKNLFSIFRLISKNEKEVGDLTIVQTDQSTLFSFFNYLFVNKEAYKNQQITKLILQHESVHAKQLHSIDILIVELVKCIFWFNPFVWLYKNEISENHEYIADKKTIESGINKTQYFNTLINQTSSTTTNSFGCGFSFIQTKNRIKMINQVQSNVKKVTLKLVVVFTLIGATFILSSFKPKNVKSTVVILNAGHGGEDTGAHFNEILEKDITMKLVQALQEIIKEDRSIILKVIRTDDQFISLEDRLSKINALNGDILIDIHVNDAPIPNKKGIDLIYSIENTDTISSKIYATALATSFVNGTNTSIELKRANFMLLKGSNCPSLTLKLGYISNEEDRNNLQSDQYIQEMAKKIKLGIIEGRNMVKENK